MAVSIVGVLDGTNHSLFREKLGIGGGGLGGAVLPNLRHCAGGRAHDECVSAFLTHFNVDIFSGS